jgi:hypothetical protein
MRLYSTAITLLIVGLAGGTADDPKATWRVLHTEVLPLTSPGACPLTHFLAVEYLAPTIEGAEQVAYKCHENITPEELRRLQGEAMARNEAGEPVLVRFTN